MPHRGGRSRSAVVFPRQVRAKGCLCGEEDTNQDLTDENQIENMKYNHNQLFPTKLYQNIISKYVRMCGSYQS